MTELGDGAIGKRDKVFFKSPCLTDQQNPKDILMVHPITSKYGAGPTVFVGINVLATRDHFKERCRNCRNESGIVDVWDVLFL